MSEPRARHILSFAQTLAGGGVERAMLRLARGWIAAGRRVTLVIGSDAGPLAGEVPPGAETIVLNDARYSALARALPAIVRAKRPDVLFCAGNHYGGAAAWTRVRLGHACPPIVGKVSNALDRRDMGLVAPGYRAWLRLHARFLDAVVAMTPGMASEAARAMRMPADRIHVIANPPARPVPGAAMPDLPPRYLLGVGRLAAQKRWDRAIAAFAALDAPDLALVILGEGEERAALAARIDRLGLAGRVLLPGHAADPLPAIAGAVAVVLTSEFEGVPGVLREALAAGTPVITTDSSVAVREIVTRADQGSVVPVDDAAALVAALRHWCDGRPRPAPLADSGDPVADYLALFDSLSSSAS